MINLLDLIIQALAYLLQRPSREWPDFCKKKVVRFV